MSTLDDTTGATRFDSFDVYRTSYKSIGDHNIDVGILIPKNFKPIKQPVVVKFHGGGLVLGDCLYPEWVAAFFVPFLHRNNAITVLPNYRFTPEATGHDILSDLADFWTWFRDHGVEKFLTSKSVSVELDYEHILVTGESAGGYMALQSGLTRPKGEIKAILAQYPMTNYVRRNPNMLFMGQPAPSNSILEEYIAAKKPGYTISSSIPSTESERGVLLRALVAVDRYEEFFGKGKQLWPFTAVEAAAYLPPTTIFHGDIDAAVAIEDSRLFVEKAKGLNGTEIRLAERPGMDHGFDIGFKESEEDWLREELRWVEGKWLA